MNFGQKIAELRKNKNLTQSELGEKLNITAQAVSKWENNLSEPDIDSVRKMCEIFEVSVNDFLGLQTATTSVEKEEITEKEQGPVKIVFGYCESCGKEVSAGEYKMTQLEYKPSSLTNKVSKGETMHTYCNSCYDKIINEQKREIKQKELNKIIAEKDESKKELKKGLIWGAIACALAALILFGSYATAPNTEMLISSIVGTIGAFTLVSQILWETFIFDFFFFFCRSFKAPFGLIFELSLDGIIWLLTVKLLLWIFFGLLSILFFLVGLVLSIIISLFSFPFTLPIKIRESKI